MSPVLRALAAADLPRLLVHTNQHYSPEMDAIFFAELELLPADVDLDVGSGSHAQQTGRMLERLETTMLERRPSCVLVQGDTNTVLAGALAAAKIGVAVGHIEAGLRSYDRRMPEELNRIVADHLSSWHFAPTPRAAEILRGEGVSADSIAMTGNTVVDAVRAHADLADRRPLLGELGLTPGQYVAATIHRPENTDDAAVLAAVVDGLAAVAAAVSLPVVLPLHPRTDKMLRQYDLRGRLDRAAGVVTLAPIGYLDFTLLLKQAACVVTDSGGIQEEACILGVPCVTVRDSTERPETVEVGANRLCRPGAETMLVAVQTMLAAPTGWANPFGDGHAGERIVDFVRARIQA